MSEMPATADQTGTNTSSWFWLRLILYVLGGLVLLAVVLVVAFVAFPPGWLARDLLTRAVEQQTGRSLTVSGPSKLSLRPRITLRLEQVALSGPENDRAKQPFAAEGLEISFNVLNWWRRQVEVPHIALQRPTITITRGDPLFEKFAEGDLRSGVMPKLISIEDGVITLPAEAPGGQVSLRKVRGEFRPSADAKGLSYQGTLAALGKDFTINGALADLAALAKGQESPLTLSARTDLLNAGFNGHLATRPIGQLTGNISASSQDLPGLLAWGNIAAEPANLGKSIKLQGDIAGSLRRLVISAARVEMDSLTGTVNGELSIEQSRPRIKASLETSKLDVNVLLPKAARPVAFDIQPREGGATLPSAWQSLLEGLENNRPTLTGTLGASVRPLGWWSSTPFQLKALPAIDVELLVKAGEIDYGDLPLKQAQILLTSSETQLNLLLNRLDLYDGSVSGRVDLDLAKGPLATDMKLKFKKLSLGPFVAELVKQRLVAGVADLDVSVSGQGGSMRELVSSLNGTATIEARKGTIVGYDLRRAVLSFGAGQSYDPARRTRFDSVTAGFAVRNGILRSSEDIRLTGPDVDITSRGSLALVSRRVDQQLSLSLKPPPLHLPIPLRIGGTFDEPSIRWDIFSAVAEPAKFATPFAVGSLGEKMPPEVREAVTARLAQDPAESQLSPAVRRFLEQLLETR